MKNYVYIIVLDGENGTRYTVRRVFESLVSADKYAKSLCSISNPLCNGCHERIVGRMIIKAEVAR